MCLANVSEETNSQSYGTIKMLRTETIYEIIGNYKGERIAFAWNYENTYDDNEGVCFIRLCIIYKPKQTEFELIMIDEKDMSKSIYTGIIEGSFKLRHPSPFKKE